MTQQPKETCQRKCRGPWSINKIIPFSIALGVDPIIIDNSPLPFEFQLQSLATKEKHAGYNISYTGMLVRIKRKSLGLLLSGYYSPSTSFAFLSMISFLINPDRCGKPDFLICFIFNFKFYLFV